MEATLYELKKSVPENLSVSNVLHTQVVRRLEVYGLGKCISLSYLYTFMFAVRRNFDGEFIATV